MTDIATPLSLRRNFSWTFAGNLVYAASQWGVLVVIARLGTPEMVGQFALALAVTAPLIMFANLQLRAVQATDAKRAYTFSDYLGLRLLTTAAALTAITLIALLAGYRAETALVILFVGLAKSCEALSDVIFGLLQQRERMDRIAKSLMIEGPATLVVMAAVLALTGSIAAAAAAMALVWLLQLLLYDARSAVRILRARPRPRWHWPTLRRLAWLALPLGVTMLLISLNANIPRYVMERTWGEAELGIFAALSYLIVAGNTIIGALGQAASPRLAAYYADANARTFRGLLLRLVGIGALLGAAAVTAALLLGAPLLALIYGPAYAAHADVFVLVMLAGGLAYVSSFLGYGMTAARFFKAQTPLFLLVVSVTAAGSLLLIPPLGIRGAALALIVSFSVQLTASLLLNLYALRRLGAAT
jgi:O-antigen/teichoic acid export membrane protein